MIYPEGRILSVQFHGSRQFVIAWVVPLFSPLTKHLCVTIQTVKHRKGHLTGTRSVFTVRLPPHNLIRDYLNEYPEVAKEYEKLKLTLWEKFEHDRDAYTNAKTDFVQHWTKEARKKYGNRY